MKNILIMITDIISLFMYFIFMFILMLIIFIPVLPILLLGMPMVLLNAGTNKTHWTEKPYLWYFKNVWLRVVKVLPT
jgi:hypothetical protein